MKRKSIFLSLFTFLLLAGSTVWSQKTATSVVTDILRMTGVSGTTFGYDIEVVIPEVVKSGKYVIVPSDIREKTANQLSTLKIKYFPNKAAAQQTLVTGTGANNNVLLSMTEPGVTISGVVPSLGTFTYYPNNPAGSEIKFNIPANLTVLFPNATTPNNVLHGQTNITTRTSDGRSFTRTGVIYISVRQAILPG